MDKRFIPWRHASSPPWWLYALLFAGIMLMQVATGRWMRRWSGNSESNWDLAILQDLAQHLSSKHQQQLLEQMVLGDPYLVVPINAVLASWLWYRGRHGDAGWIVRLTGGITCLQILTKYLVHRPRPVRGAQHAHKDRENTYSFPSGHAMHSVALSAACATLAKESAWRQWVRAGGVLYVLVAGITRILSTGHYPTDVLAGWSMALSWLLGIRWLERHHH